MLSGQLWGIVLIFALDKLIDLNPEFHSVWIPSNFTLVGVTAFACVLLLVFNGEYKRLHSEDRDLNGGEFQAPLADPFDPRLLEDGPEQPEELASSVSYAIAPPPRMSSGGRGLRDDVQHVL